MGTGQNIDLVRLTLKSNGMTKGGSKGLKQGMLYVRKYISSYEQSKAFTHRQLKPLFGLTK